MEPYFERDGIVIYHGDCRDVLPVIGDCDVVLTDPPYGIGKRERTYQRIVGAPQVWDAAFSLDWTAQLPGDVRALGIMAGVANLGRCPETIGALEYRWTLAAHLVNGMTRGPFGFGNWIPCVIYAAHGVSLYRKASDVARIAIGRSAKPNHPSPKPIEAMRWLLGMMPDGCVLDPFAGSGTTLVAALEQGRRAIGIEIEERYCEIAAKRLEQAVLPLEIPA